MNPTKALEEQQIELQRLSLEEYMSKQRAEQYAESPPEPQFQPRTDNIGLLARRLLGDRETPPDLTAAVPLYDELIANQMHSTAESLMRVMFDLRGRIDRFRAGRQELQDAVTGMLWGIIGHLTVDFNWLCLDVAQRLQTITEPQIQETTAPVNLIEYRVPEDQWMPEENNHFSLPDGRNGIVVSVDGRTIRMFITGSSDGGREVGYGSPMTNSFPLGTRIGGIRRG